MRVRTYSSTDEQHQFGEFHWDLAFVGADLDERSRAAIVLVNSAAKETHQAEFTVEQPHRLRVGANLLEPKELAKLVGKARSLVLETTTLETTTLGTVEVLQFLRAARDAHLDSVDCLYVEPKDYEKDTFLESSWYRVAGVPPFLPMQAQLTDRTVRLVAMLGYESSRLAGIFEQNPEMVGWRKFAVVGVPGYSPGWEQNALANNVDTLDTHQFYPVRYCSASSVSGAYDLLTEIHAEGHDENPHTTVAPLGTKPHGIAAAMFLVDHSSYQQASLLYDHPIRIKGRSSKVRRWHLYRIDLTHKP
ncbi:MAG: hypothetical protein PPHEINF_5777 [uncultured Paraburkholderia sp.]|nr:MAG: hypothetical protein PPHEINF_5777 [uncultured Paraburkholderia sp.]CAH2807934.1 MAG: hypothetical protein PPHEESC_5884 [uncultured Paraburkholderia sp.]CAH2942655.1 MAG: hypothetical protein PPHEMADMSA_5801 [uncultured Paraburkholderia sp.]CAH2943758.1 MAG: hypothetical protein PPHERAN_5845 [uncultured Paraburkholderia sp.]